METTSIATGKTTNPYERYAAIFSLAHENTHSIATALEVVDGFRARERAAIPVDLPTRVLEAAGSLFSVTLEQLRQPGRHRDKTSARYVAAWVLSRRHWASAKIAEMLGLESSTVRHGIIHVAKTEHLRTVGCQVELLVLGL